MKRIIKLVVTISFIGLFVFMSGNVMAAGHDCGKGHGYGHGKGGCAGMGVCKGLGKIDIRTGEAVTVSGKVTEIGVPCVGQVNIDTGSDAGIVTVHGIGPVAFWEQKGVKRPAVGDDVVVSAYNVKLEDGSMMTFAEKMTGGESEVVFRDAETGMPLWSNRGDCMRRGGMRGCRANCAGKGPRNPNCPYAKTDTNPADVSGN